jgi:type III secretion system-like peptide-binding chaperone
VPIFALTGPHSGHSGTVGSFLANLGELLGAMVTDTSSDALVSVAEFSDGRYVQFRCSPDRALVAEVLSNLNIGEAVALSPDAEDALRGAGWNEPIQWVAPNWWTEAKTTEGLLALTWMTNHAVLNVLAERPGNQVEIRTWSWSIYDGMKFDDLCRTNRHYFQEALAAFEDEDAVLGWLAEG